MPQANITMDQQNSKLIDRNTILRPDDLLAEKEGKTQYHLQTFDVGARQWTVKSKEQDGPWTEETVSSQHLRDTCVFL